MRTNRKFLALMLIALLLVFVILYVGVKNSSRLKETAVPVIVSMLPETIPGWSFEDLPVGEMRCTDFGGLEIL